MSANKTKAAWERAVDEELKAIVARIAARKASTTIAELAAKFGACVPYFDAREFVGAAECDALIDSGVLGWDPENYNVLVPMG